MLDKWTTILSDMMNNVLRDCAGESPLVDCIIALYADVSWDSVFYGILNGHN